MIDESQNEQNDYLRDLSIQLLKSYDRFSSVIRSDAQLLPNKRRVLSILKQLRDLIFPHYYGNHKRCAITVECALMRIRSVLTKEISRVLGGDEAKATTIADAILLRLPAIRETLSSDIEAALSGDPAATSTDEIIFSYPGIYAIMVYRIAHELYKHNVPLIGRILSEHAHSKTGIDIHPGASIGHHFFIDHGTGIVIGETTVIGNHVKIYQGVTLGGISTRGGQTLRGVKRHPTIEDNVTIYSGASIFGGATVIGKHVVIGANAFVATSVPEYTKVSVKSPQLQYKNNGKQNYADLSMDEFWTWTI
ncbi:MAG: serine acetyltransferase [Helicobacteraceae bacterium]|jgi:serine O-acetyltransferase|nr:serine acetyltransferase [Helicobacteraceae bacterium]